MSAIPISNVMEQGCISIVSRKDLVQARRDFFSHVLAVFNSLANESANRAMAEWGMKTPIPPRNEEIFQNPQRGWLMIRENENRPYSMTIWQSGKWIRIGIAISAANLGLNINWNDAMKDIFYGHLPYSSVRGDLLMFDWHFETPDFFTSLPEQETWVMAIHHLYDMVGNMIANAS